jgi:glutathione S-transferase
MRWTTDPINRSIAAMTRVLYGFPLSGNSYRVRLVLQLLELPFEDRLVNLATGAQRQPEFLARNPLGQVPVLIDGARVLRDSHAIVGYLASSYGPDAWYPGDPYERALIQQWMFFDANELHNGIGYARNHFTFGIPWDGEAARKRGIAALAVLEQRLAARDWLELDRPTLADITCFPLVALSEDAKISLAAFPSIQAWLQRVRALPGFVPMIG